MLLSQQRITPKIRDLINFKPKKRYLNQSLNRFIPFPYKYWVGSGREALRQILCSIEGRRVGLPAYTCHVVLDAVKRSGAKPIFYDSGVIAELNDLKKIINKVDVLIVSYNFGFVPEKKEMKKIVDLCKKHQVILIEDCAQALGARQNGKLAGSFGDYAFYSFGISKNIGFCGGLIASKKKLKLTRTRKNKTRKYPTSKLIKLIIQLVISPLFFHPRIYPFTRSLLQEKLHQKQETLAYTCPPLARKVVSKQLRRYFNILNLRQRNFNYCVRELKGIIDFLDGDTSGLYFVIRSKNSKLLKRRLLKEEVELGEMFTFQALAQGKPKAQKAEKEVLTFALYRNFEEVKYIVKKIKKVCQDGNC